MDNGRSEKRFVSFVSQDDPAFRAEERRIADKTKRGSNDAAFGAGSLDYHHAMETAARQMNERVAAGSLRAHDAERKILGDRKRSMESIRRNFDVLLTRGRRDIFFKSDVSFMIYEALEDDDVRAAWGDQRPPVEDDGTFWELFGNDEIPDRVFIAILEQRKRRQAELQKEWEGKFEGWKSEFRLELKKAVMDGHIPRNERYDERIDDVRILVADPIAMGSLAGRDHGAGILSVRVESREEGAIRKTVFHEMTHRVAGGAIQRTDTEAYDHDSLLWQSADYVNRKHGLAFNAERGFRINGTWLNEGMTELLARYLANVEEMTSYSQEQTLILEIMRSGLVPRSLFVNAYFEGHLAEPENGSRLPAFRALSLAMTEAYGAGWLKKFGRMVVEKYREMDRDTDE